MDTGDSPSIALCISAHFTNTRLASVGCQVPATPEPCALRAHFLAAVPSQVSGQKPDRMPVSYRGTEQGAGQHGAAGNAPICGLTGHPCPPCPHLGATALDLNGVVASIGLRELRGGAAVPAPEGVRHREDWRVPAA